MKLLKYIIVTILAVPLFAFATPVSWDYTTNLLQPLLTGRSAEVKVPYITATSTTQTNTFPRYTATHGTTTNATSTNMAITTSLNIFGTIGTALSDFCVSITGGSGLCDGTDATSAGAGSGTISTSTNPTIGDLAYWNGLNTIGSVATGTLTETATGLEFSATRALVGGASILSLTSGFNIPLTASTSNWEAFYLTPSTRITAGTGIDWSGNTLNGVYTAGDGITLNTEDFDCDTATGSVFGCLTATDWNTFNNKIGTSSIPVVGSIAYFTGDKTVSSTPTTTLTATAPIALSNAISVIGNSASVITCATATGSVTGCLSNTDWTTFNQKVASTSIDTLAELETLQGGINILSETEIDASSELALLMDDETGTAGSLVFSVSPTLTGLTTMTNYFATLGSTTNATSSYLSVNTGLDLFGGGMKTTANALCIQLTGSAALCDGTDATGGGGLTGTIGQVAYFSGTDTAVGTSSLYITTAGNVGIGTTTDTYFSGNPSKLLIDSGNSTSQQALTMRGNVNDFYELNIKNVSAGALAQSCLTTTNDTGSATTGFLAICANSSGFSNPQTYNTGGANDSSIMSLTNRDFLIVNGTAGQALRFLTGGTATATAEKLTILANGSVGIGTTTPSALFAIASSTYQGVDSDGNVNKLFSISTSTNGGGSLFTIFATSSVLTATTSAATGITDSGVRMVIGYDSVYNGNGVRDQLQVNGRINTGQWRYYECTNAMGSLTSDTAAGVSTCGMNWAFQIDTAGGLGITVTDGIAVSSICLGSATCGGSAAGTGAGVFFNGNTGSNPAMFSTTTPVMDTYARIRNPQSATSTRMIIGHSNINPAGTAFETEPTVGCYFVSSTTLANWQAKCLTSISASTIVDTGFASTTKKTATGDFYRFRIEADNKGARFLMASSTQPLKTVAYITSNYPTTTALATGVFIAQQGGTGSNSAGIDYNIIRLWLRQPFNF